MFLIKGSTSVGKGVSGFKTKALGWLFLFGVLVYGVAGGYMVGHYNVQIVTESDWHQMTTLRAEAADADYALMLCDNLEKAGMTENYENCK